MNRTAVRTELQGISCAQRRWLADLSADASHGCGPIAPRGICTSLCIYNRHHVHEVSQCFAVYCSVLQCVAMCGSVFKCVAVCCSVMAHARAALHVQQLASFKFRYRIRRGCCFGVTSRFARISSGNACPPFP